MPKYTVIINGEERTIDKDKFDGNIEAISAKYPDAKIKAINGDEEGMLPVSNYLKAIEKGYRMVESKTDIPVSRFVQGKGKDTTIFGVPYSIYAQMKPESQSYYYQKALNEEREQERKQMAEQASSIKGKADEQHVSAMGDKVQADYDAVMNNPFLTINDPMMGVEMKTPEQTKSQKKVELTRAASERADDAFNMIEEAGKKGNTSFVSGFGRGFWEKVSKASTWDFGGRDMQANLAIASAAKKYESGQPLSNEEENLLDAVALEAAANGEFSGDLGRGYKAGMTTAESLPFMAEFMINPATGTGEAISKAAAKKIISNFGKEAAKSTIGKIARNSVRVAGDIAGAGIMSGTTGAMRTSADAVDRMIGDVSPIIDSDGYYRFGGTEGGEGLGKSLVKAYGASTIENFSEMFGNYLAPIGGVLGTSARKGMSKIGLGKVNKVVGDIKSSDIARVLDDFQSKTQWNGTIGEYLEEQAGMAMNALTVGDNNLSDFIDVDTQIDTFLGVSSLGGLFSGIKTFGYAKNKYSAKQKLNEADRSAANNSEIDELDWNDLKERINQADDSELVSILSETFRNDDIRDDSKQAILLYAGRLKAYHGASLADLKRKTEGDTPDEIVQSQMNFDEGYKLAEAGRSEKRSALRNMNELGRKLDDEFIYASDEDRYNLVRQRADAGEDVSNELAYINSQSKLDGMILGIRDAIDGKVAKSNQYITNLTHQDGNVYDVTLTVDEKKHVFPISGKIVFDENGIVDRKQSDSRFIVRDNTGKVEMRSVEDLYKLESSNNADELKDITAQSIREQESARHAEEIETPSEEEKAEEVASIQPGDVISLDMQGTKATATVQSKSDGSTILQFDDPIEHEGKKVQAIELPDEQLQTMIIPEEEKDSNVIDSVSENGVSQLTEENRLIDMPMGAEEIINQEEESADEVGSKSPLQDDSASTISIPIDDKGNLLYHKAPVEMTIADLNDGNLTADEVDAFVSANRDETTKLLKKVSEKAPKIGTNKARYLEEKKRWADTVADINSQVAYWNEVEAQLQATREQPGDTTANEIKAMGEPLNGAELAAMMLGAGRLPLLYNDYKRETGFSNSDARGMFGMFSTKDNGGMTVEQAGEQLMLADMEAGTNFFDQNDPNAGRNAILDVLSSARTRGGLINYIKNNREAMAERERQAEAEADELAKEQWFQDNYHMTFEEYQLWEQGELFTESNMISDEEYQKFMSIFADRILNEQENDRRTSQESGSSIAESESNEQGGISGVRESSSTVLQGEESVSAGTTGRVEEESGQIDANGSVEYDALQSGTSRGELVSSSRNQENVPESILPRIEGESLLDYAGRVNDAHVLHEEEQKVNLNPTDAQKETGNYKKGHIKVDGFDITIENPKGSERSGVDANGKSWSITMNNTYGYIRGTEGVDGDHIDLFLGNSGNGVYVVDQVNEDGSFDEHKVMYGFGSIDEAKEAYLSNYSPGWKGLGNITSVSKETFKKWIESSRRKTKPFSEYKISQNKKTWQMTAKEYAYSVGSPKMEIEIDSGVSFHQLSKMSEKAKESRAKQRIEKRNIANNKYRLAVEEWENKIWDAYLNGEFSANDVYDTEAFYVLSERINDLGVDMDSPFKISKRNPQERETYLKGIDSILSEKKQADSEEQSIIERAKDNGTYMKAPNGKPTRLDERQWVQVRTTAFKRWFGDWEQSPENASKVLDENGEPLVVYHGTSGGGFTIFNTYGSNFGLFGQGSYFTDSREVAESYTEKGKGDKRQVYGVFLNIRRPLDMNSHDIAKGWKEALPDDINVEIGEDSTNESVYKSVLESFEYNEYPKSEAQEILYDLPVALGYDGVTHIGGGRYNKTSDIRHQVWIAMEPTQIKSATDNKGEFSGDNGDIRFREVYHGSPHDFDQFDHSFINTGEGVQAFGWGTYVTEVNGIAKGYAEKLASRSQTKRINELARSVATKKDFIKARKQDIKRNEDYDKYARAIKKNLKGLYTELKNAKKEENEKDVQFYQSLVELVEQQLDRDYYNNLIDSFWNDINNSQKEIDEMEKDIADLNREIKELKGKRHLYTVEIPDCDGINYLNWNKPLTDIQKNMIADQAEKDGYGDYQISYRDENGNLVLNTSSDVTGEALYKELSKEFLLGSDKAASEFLNRAGFVGIEYPAEAMSGGREDNAKNYVIFNEKDLAVEEHVRFRDKGNGAIKTYHGSGAEFDKFDLAHSGEGKGESMIGKGVYTTKDKQIATNYSDVVGNREIGGRKHLYEVEIPTDNGKNYLDYDKVYDMEEMSEIAGRLHNVGVNVDFGRYFNGGKANGKSLYMVMDWSMPDGMNVNQALSDAGYVGYKYSTRHDLGGKEKLFPKKSYVVFDEGNTTISSHEQIESEIEKLSDVLHVPVKMVSSLDELSDGMARRAIENGRNVKGWFDTKTGEVVVYLPNVTGEEDAKATFLHEIVGHKGLRALLGEKSFDDEMVRLYGLLPAEERKIVTSAAVHDYGGNVAIAMDEYLAEQAEKDETPSWWNKVVSAIRDLLRKKGINVTLSKGDVKYLLWRSRKKLESANPFDVAKDITMRYRLSLGEFNDSSFQQKYEQMKDEMERLNLLNSHNVYLANDKDELCFQMSTDGASARSIDYIRSIFDKAEEEQKNFFGFFDYETGKIYLCANQIKHIEQLRAKWGHEICHQITSKIPDSSLADLYDIIGADEVDGLIGDAYYSLSKERKVDEYISTIVEEIISDQESFDEIMNGENIDTVLENWELPYAIVPYIANSFKSIFYGKKEDKEVLGIERGGKERENELRLSGDVRTQGEEGAEGRGSQEGKIRFRLGETNKGEDRLRRKVEEQSNGSGVEDFSSQEREEIAQRMYEDSLDRVKNKMYRWQEAYQDSMLGLKKLQEAIVKESGEVLKYFEDAYMAENQMSSKSAFETEVYKDKFLIPMLDAIKAITDKGVNRDDVNAYVMAKHGLERNIIFAQRDAEQAANNKFDEQISEINKSLDKGDISHDEWEEKLDNLNLQKKDFYEAEYENNRLKDYSGLTQLTNQEEDYEEAAKEIVDQFEEDHGELCDQLWEKINLATKYTLKKSYESGLMTRSTYDKVRNMFEYYVPLRGWNDDIASDVYEYILSERSIFQAPVKAALGRKSQADDPFANIGNMAESGILQGNRNLMKQKFLNMVLNRPTSLTTVKTMWYENTGSSENPKWVQSIPDIPVDATTDEIGKAIEDHEARMIELKKSGMATKSTNSIKLDYRASTREKNEHTVVVKSGGKEYVIYINGNPRAAQAINGLTNPDALDNKFMKGIQWLNRQMAANFTTRNPAFILSNMSRDIIFSTSAIWIKENWKYAKRFDKNIVRNTKAIVGLMARYKSDKLDMSNSRDRYFLEFLENGGETGYTALHNVEEYKKMMDRHVKKSNGAVGSVSYGIHAIVDAISFMNRCAENVSRFTTYQTSREMGRGISESVRDAKEVTVNFNKKGAGGLGAGTFKSLFLFFNAAVQSLNNFKGLHDKSKSKFYTSIGGFATAGVLVPMINNAIIEMLIGDGDDDMTDEERMEWRKKMDAYDNLPEWVRRNNFCIWIGGERFITIPLPIELRAFYGMGEMWYQAGKGNMNGIDGKVNTKKVSVDMVNQLTELLPINPLGGNGDALSVIVPDAGKPLYQAFTNRDFFGKPIYKKSDYNEVMPAWTKAYTGTAKWMVNSAEFINEVSGGDKYMQGAIDMNPAVIEYIFEGYFGGMGKTANQLYKTISMIWEEDERMWRNVPVANRFISGSDNKIDFRKMNETYYQYMDEFQVIEQRLRGYENEANMGIDKYAEKYDFLNESKENERYQVMKEYKSIIDDIYKSIKESDPDEKKEMEMEVNLLKMEMIDELSKIK
ncbi:MULTISPECIES: LPD38 domain-containing protein [Bacteroides]|jgi:hypothetical protein|uniref:LPD38 domain-containing protein n=1 Tax=Bacteroides ovatus TaxID=28116 RepID=UPI001CCA4A21|nr:LPD38 domain-containing protein [Bacteroides ovatus]UBF06634.1 hypothetical protein K6V23_19625 [Bacteroides ovatus]